MGGFGADCNVESIGGSDGDARVRNVSAPPRHFAWDDTKAAANLVKHGVPFRVAIAVFADPKVRVLDSVRPQDHESRRKAIGMIADRLFTVVFVMRGEVCRLISARRANAGEERAYGTCDPRP